MSMFDPHSWTRDDQPATRHLDFDLVVDFEKRRIAGRAILCFHEPGSGPLDLDARGLEISAVTDPDGRDLEWSIAETDPVRGDRLRVDLPEGTPRILIDYATGPGAPALGWLEPAQTAGEHPFMFSQCQPIHARSMFPCQDTPRYRISYAGRIQVPDPLRAVMSAKSTGSIPGRDPGTTYWTFEMTQPIPTYLLALAVGRLEKARLGDRSVVYAEPETLESAAWEFQGVDAMLQKAESLFGPYEWERFDLLVMPPSFPYGGMENPRLTFLTPTLIAGDRSLVNVVAHELAHSWTGNLVTNATMNDFWLNEGFTVWAESRILEALHGEQYAAMQAAIRRNGLQVNLEQFGPGSPYTRLRNDLAGIDPDEIYSLVPYVKGFMLVTLLERHVGRETFDAFLRRYIDRFRFQSITTDEFIAFIDAELPGALDAVEGRKWIDEPDIPANEPRFASARLDAVNALAAGWDRGERPQPDAAREWSPAEWQIYLQALPRNLPDAECRWLDETFGLNASGNNEILVAWLTIAAGSAYEPAFARIRDVLSTVGRMKYLKPLYAALLGNEKTRPLASEIFADVRESYHPLSVGSIEGMFED